MTISLVIRMKKFSLLFILFTICLEFLYALEGASWTGKVFPNSYPNQLNQEDLKSLKKYMSSDIVMGVRDPNCDNGEDLRGYDGDLSQISYTCFDNKTQYIPNKKLHPLHKTMLIPKAYRADHVCMDAPISYNSKIPTYGPHRALWPKYGEYTIVPPQRWIHNLEHGAIVLLYHPCADKNELNILRKIVKKCLYKYIITAYQELSPERPLALVAWGHSLEISKVYSEMAVEFIKKYAHRGYEKTNADGQYGLNLIEPSTTQVVNEICANF